MTWHYIDFNLQKIDKFFTKEITYLVTDHAQDSDYKTSKAKAGEEGDASTPSPFGFTPGSGVGTPPESTGSSAKSKLATSRGSAILAKIRGGSSQQVSLFSFSTITYAKKTLTIIDRPSEILWIILAMPDKHILTSSKEI